MSLESNENQELARDTSGPLSGAVWAAIRRFRLLVIYLGALGALLLAVTKLRTPLDQLGQFFNLPAKWLLVLIGGLPLASAFAFDTIPEWLRKRRDYKLSEYGVSGSVSQPGYFRIYPYENTQRDIERYQRPDGADEKILEWLSHASDSILYLTARSGAGKTSLLHASVLPRLRERSPAVVSITVRGYQRPVEALRQAVLKPGPIWTRPPAEALDFRALMDRACSHIRPCRLLIILDQFEESLIVQSKNELRSLREALLSVSNHPIDGLSFLLVVRSDYVGVLQDLDLPIMKQNQNWKEISPFLESAARDFLGKSNLKIGAQLLDSIMSDAAEIEETRGLIRPITLNMIG
ncbi:MAG: ATP-binding protein, partial [Blastocatellia bacterium]